MRYLFLLAFSIVFILDGKITPISQAATTNTNSFKESEFVAFVRKGDTKKTKELLKNGINPNLLSNGKSVLEIALRDENYEMFKQLLDYGANPMQPIKKDIGFTVISLAAMLEDDRFLKLLFEYEIKIEELNHFYTMAGTILKNRLSNLQFLLSKGFNINARNNENNTLLILSSLKSEVSHITKYLLENGANADAVNDMGDSALLVAISKEPNRKNIEYLLKYTTDIDKVNKNGSSAVLRSLIVNNNDALEQLIQAGANLVTYRSYAKEPLLYALYENKYSAAKIIVDSITIKKELYLKFAISYGNHKMFNFLLDNGFKITKYKFSKKEINMYLANNRDKELKEYMNIYGLDTFNLRHTSLKAQKKLLHIIDELYIDNSLSDTQKNLIAKSLNSIGESKRAYEWIQTIDITNQAYDRCYIKANIGKEDIEACIAIAMILGDEKNYGSRSWALLIAKKYERAIEAAKKAVTKKDGYHAYSNMGHAYLLQGKKEKAYEAYKNYFTKTKYVNALNAIKPDFDMLKLNYPEKISLFDDAYEYCKEIDFELFRKYLIF